MKVKSKKGTFWEDVKILFKFLAGRPILMEGDIRKRYAEWVKWEQAELSEGSVKRRKLSKTNPIPSSIATTLELIARLLFRIDAKIDASASIARASLRFAVFWFMLWPLIEILKAL